MKKQILLLLAFIVSLHSFGQKKEKFGNVSEQELQMKSYEKEPGAPAVVLYEERETRYDYDPVIGMVVKNEYFARIKILTNDGLEYANQHITYYIGKSRTTSENISGLTGNTYNLVNGKVEKTKLSKENIFEEKVSEDLMRTKFAFPNVQPGSVIEYKYELTSPRDAYLEDCIFQRSIPVVYSKYYLMIPEYYTFSKETKGPENIKVTQSYENQSFNFGSNSLTFTANAYLFEVENLSGLKDEDYVWCIKDFLTRVTFELRSFSIPGVFYKDFAYSWTNVDNELLESSSFGKQFNHKLFKNELSGLLLPDMNDIQKVQAILYLIRSKVKWNEENTLTAKNPKDALKKGLGTSGEINALLISALREAGFDAYPVVMSLRYKGRIPITHPTIDNLNYFIAAVDIDGKPAYLDASSKYGDVNILSPTVMSDYARSIRDNNRSGWIDLSTIGKNRNILSLNLEFNKDGVLSGTSNQMFLDESGYDFRRSYYNHKDHQDYIEKKETAENISISDFEIKGLENTGDKIIQLFNFTKNDVTTGGDHIYFNPLVFPIFRENPFKAEIRKLPVEFSYPLFHRISAKLKIPEGYIVEELPENGTIKLNDDDATFQYIIEYNKELNIVNMSVQYSLKKAIYLSMEYEYLRNFFSYITTVNTALIVLKKT